MSFDSDKLLDAWLAPADSGAPVACVATTFTFDPGFFDEDCLARFLGLDAAVLTGGDETDTLTFVLEREEALSNARAAVLVDRSSAQASASFRWDVIPVQAGRGGVQHSKVSLLLWEDRMRLIVASANLTQAGYRSNIEVFGVYDDDDPFVSNELFADAIEFLATVADKHTEGAGGEHSPRGRVKASLRLARARIRTRRDSKALQHGPTVRLVHTLHEDDVLTQAFEGVWQDRGQPSYFLATSPYFDRVDTAGLRALSNALADRRDAYGELAVVARDAGDNQVKIEAPEHLRALTFPRAPELFGWPATEQSERALHAKTYVFSNGRRVMGLFGSPNATVAGFGIGGTRNIEAAIALSDRAGSDIAREIEARSADLVEIPAEGRVFDASAGPEEDDRQRPLPTGFVEALYFPNENFVRITLRLRGLPATWAIRRGGETWLTSEDPFPDGGVHERDLLAENAPRSLTVEWSSADGSDTFASELVVAVADAAELPDPPEIQALTLEELLDLLAIGGRLRDYLRRLVERRLSGGAPGPEPPPELDPHRRVNTSDFMLQRIRRISYALEGLKRKLGEPISNPDALDRRLRGPFGALGLRDAADKATEDGGMSPRERAFLLAELALVLARVDWRPVSDAVSVSRCRKEARKVVGELHPQKTGDSSLDAYVTSAFESSQ